ncbi:MAG TPA: MFS transporter [Vicinamibacterales bacterium]|nr:MFS transporter [Vicinamibacterales bacterium]
MSTVSVFPALRHRNFRLLWGGLLVSFAGSFMQTAAILWHVSLLAPDDKRALALGMVGLVRVGPIIVFSLISGVAADALDRRKLMLVTQSLMAALAALLAVLSFRGHATLGAIYLLAAVSSAAGAFDLPARQALLPNLVPREDLPNAISLNTIMMQIASVAGPALGGLVIAAGGVAWVYALNAASFVLVIVALLMMRIDARPAHDGGEADGGRGDFTFAAALEGLRFVFRAPLIRSTMLLDFFATFFSSATALLPIFAQDVLHVGARGYGWLYAAPAVGAVLASLVMVRAVDWIEHRGVVLITSIAIYGAATALFGLSRAFWLSFACLAVTGVADTVSMIFRNLIRQLETPDRLRGRMVGVNMVFFIGGPQLGELEAGLVANAFGPVLSVVTGGLGCLVATAWVAARTPRLRAYRRTTLPHVSIAGPEVPAGR